MERPRDRAASVAVLTAIPMVGQLIASRAIRDTVFLTEFSAALLPRVMLGSAALSLLAAWAVARVMPRWGPRATAVVLAMVNAVIFAAEAALFERFASGVAVALYLHVSVVGALVISAFSSVVNERFDPMHAKAVVAHAGTGGALGGVLGGALALFVVDAIPMTAVLYGLSATSALMANGMWRIGPSTQPDHHAEDPRSGFSLIRDDRYLRNIATTIVLLGAAGVLADYAMKAEADLRFVDSTGLLSFFSIFYTATALLTFLIQAGAAKPLLARVGLGGTMAVLPLSLAVFAGVGAVWTHLVTAVLARGSQTVISSSLFRSGYELLYTPIPPTKKRATKALIDIACNRTGYGIGSLVVMALVALTPTLDMATTSVLIVATVVALASAWMVWRLHDGYIKALASSLHDGSVVLQSDDVFDATTLHTLARSATTMDRYTLLQSIEEHERLQGASVDDTYRQRTTTQLDGLLSDDPARVLAALVDPDLDVSLAAQVVRLLATDLYAQPAYGALEAMGSRVTGQLVDAMLAEETPEVIRRRIPRLLRKTQDPRAAQGLVTGLADEAFEVRYRCGHALASLRRDDPSRVSVSRAEVMSVIAAELASNEDVWRRRMSDDGDLGDLHSEIDALLAKRQDRNLQHVFTLLSLTLDREAIVLSLRALSSDDDNLRGTALEYLHNVLPEEVRTSLWPRLTAHADRTRTVASPKPPEELLESMQSLMLDRDRLES
ncbi:MAG: Npt1/Npt2 family nucleotide transporter [Myxococcota bacterium]